MWGVMPWWGMVRHGWSAGAGCGYQTSPAYPASWPLSRARTIASRSTISAAGGVDQVGPATHLADQLVVEHVLCLGVQRRVDGDHVAVRTISCVLGVEGQAELPLDLGRAGGAGRCSAAGRRTGRAAAARRARSARRRPCRRPCPRGRRSGPRSRRCSSRPCGPTGSTGGSCAPARGSSSRRARRR